MSKTYLQQAQDAWRQAQIMLDEAEGSDSESRHALYMRRHAAWQEDAAILAQLAQAEALTCIAEALETFLEIRCHEK